MFIKSDNTKWSLFFLSLLLIASNIVAYPPIKSFVGTIQYPSIKSLPQMSAISYEGQQITITECDDANNKIFYKVPLSRNRQKNTYCLDFYFLFTEGENITFTLKDNDELAINNTIDHLTLEEKAKYRIFKATINNNYDRKTKKTTVTWTIKEMALSQTRQIPDSTLIFPIPAHYVKELSGGDAMQLPTIIIKDNVHLLAGGEDKMHELALRQAATCPDLKAIHIQPSKAITQVGASILIIPTI